MITNLEMDRMQSTLSKFSSILLFLLLFCTSVLADTAHINYVSSTSDHYTKLKSELEDLGYTVTGTNSGTVTLSDFSSKDLHINIAGDSNCGNTCKTAYETYIGNGGNVIIAGSGVYNNNRAGNIEALIESKLSVGTITIHPYNANYSSNANGSYSGDASSGYWLTRNLFTMQSGGTAIASNSPGGSTYKSWAKYDYGSNGGQLFVTFDQSQFKNSVSTWMTRFYAFFQQTLENEGILLTATYTSSISNAQTTQITTSRAVTHSGNGIYINQVGNSNSLTIVQDGDDNLIAGVGSTTNSLVDADITGNNNTTTLKQKGNNNVMLFDITGNSNTTTVDQGSTSGADDNRVEFDINGDTNVLSVTQNHNNGVGTNGHFFALDLDGDNNNVLASQLNDGDKKAFLSVQGDDNDIDLIQQGAGSHYAEIAVGSDQTVDITQDGSGQHNASVSMTGFSATLDLDQSGSTNQTYSLNQNCLNANGCGTTTVNQQ